MFNLNWEKKTKIIVDGKEYDRMEDLPEHLRALIKESDAAKKTLKIKPIFKINLPPGQPLNMDPAAPVALPKGFRLKDNGGERLISWSWISLRVVGAALFIVVWNSILAAVLYGMSLSKNPPWFVIASLLLMAAGGAAMTYAVAAYLLNRTIVRVDAVRVIVRHTPLPWFGMRNLVKGEIDKIFSEKYEQLDDDSGWEPRVTYKVLVILKDGAKLSLVSGLTAPEQALFIEQQVRTTLKV